MAANHKPDEHNRYYFIDDSRKPENWRRNQRQCEEFTNRYQINLLYFGPEQQIAWLEQLKSTLPEHAQGIDFLLARHEDEAIPSYGRSRNWALLLAAGQNLAIIDDDVLLQRIRPPMKYQGTEITSLPRSTELFQHDDDWQAYQDRDNPDPLHGLFNNALGLKLPVALSLLESPKLTSNAVANLLPADYSRITPQSRILVTSYGYAKDPGSASNDWIYKLKAGSLKRLLQSRESYDQHLRARNLWLGSPGYAFRNHFPLMAGITGVAAGNPMPPYFPSYRNEDFLFSEMLHSLYPKDLFLDPPWAVPHLPAKEREWYPNSIYTPASHDLLGFSADTIYFNFNKSLEGINSPHNRYVSLTRYFADLGGLSDQVLIENIIQQTLQKRTAYIARLTGIIENSVDTPDFWIDDLQRTIAANEQSLVAPLPEGFRGLPGDARQQRSFAQQLWASFSQGLQAWEACMEVAKLQKPS